MTSVIDGLFSNGPFDNNRQIDSITFEGISFWLTNLSGPISVILTGSSIPDIHSHSLDRFQVIFYSIIIRTQMEVA